MKWTFVIQQKLKIAVLLGAIMCVVVLFNLILQKNISDINNSVNSIYNDRLIPATDIFHLSENLHARQLAMEMFLNRSDRDLHELRAELKRIDGNMFDLIHKYEKTYLVDEESVFLNQFKDNMASYSKIEKQILLLSSQDRKSEGSKLYETEGRAALGNTVSQLSDLTTIQSAVGSKLVDDTRGKITLSNYLSDIQLVLAIVIGAMITALVVSSKIINQPQAKFRWN